MRYEDFKGKTKRQIDLRLVPIYQWLQAKKPNLAKKGISSVDFALW